MAFAAGVGGMLGLGSQEWAAMTAGACFPDVMDSVIAGRSREVWQGIHRTVSHWPVLYPIALAFLFFAGAGIPTHVFLLICMFVAGALIHISCDLFTPMGIPLAPPFTKRVSLKIISTGTVSDYAFGFLPMAIYVLFFA